MMRLKRSGLPLSSIFFESLAEVRLVTEMELARQLRDYNV
jgi:hypothetical protein